MIGHRITVGGNQFDYVFGLLVDEGLRADVDLMPAGGGELVVAEDAWERLDGETRGEVLRFALSSTASPDGEVVVASPDGEVVVARPAGGDGADDPTVERSAARSRSGRSPRSTTKGVRDAR